MSSLRPSRAAISLLRLPCETSSSTWISRGVSVGARRAVEPGLDVGSNRPSAGVDFAHEADQIVGKRVLQQVGGGARGERAMDVLIALVHRQHDDAGVGVVAPDRLDGVEPLRSPS